MCCCCVLGWSTPAWNCSVVGVWSLMCLCCYRALHNTLTSLPHLHSRVVRPLLSNGNRSLFWHQQLPLQCFFNRRLFRKCSTVFRAFFPLAGIKCFTVHIVIIHGFSVMHRFFSSFVFMLAVIMRGSFIIHAVIDVPLVGVFMPQSHQTLLRQQHIALPNTPCLQIKMLGVGFQLPFSKPHSVVHIVVVLGKWAILPRKVYKTTLKCSLAVLTCFFQP